MWKEKVGGGDIFTNCARTAENQRRERDCSEGLKSSGEKGFRLIPRPLPAPHLAPRLGPTYTRAGAER